MRVFVSTAFLLLFSACSFGLDQAPVLEDAYGSAPVMPAPEDELPRTEASLEGRLYAIAPGGFRVTEPPGLDGLLGEVLERDILVHVADETDDTLSFEVTLAGPDGLQDPCETVRPVPDGDWSENPVFAAGPGRLDVSFGGDPAAFRDLRMDGVFDTRGTSWSDGTVSANLDVRELASSLGSVRDACALVEQLEGACEPCEDGTEACFDVRFEDVFAEMIEADFSSNPGGARCTD